jgi:hypothetical protein
MLKFVALVFKVAKPLVYLLLIFDHFHLFRHRRKKAFIVEFPLKEGAAFAV